MAKHDIKKILKYISLSILFLFIAIYALFRSQGLLLGVKIKNVNLIDGAKMTDSLVELKGNAEHAVILTLNGREISIDQAGNFKEDIALLPGYNIISLNAKDKFGKSDEKNYQLIY